MAEEAQKTTGKNVHERVADSFLEFINQTGELPWRKDWVALSGGQPVANLFSGRPYQGVNQFALSVQLAASGHTCPYFTGFHQAKKFSAKDEKGEKVRGAIKKAAKSSVVYKVMFFDPEAEEGYPSRYDSTRRSDIEDQIRKRTKQEPDDEEVAEIAKRLKFCLRAMPVFNVEQCDNLESHPRMKEWFENRKKRLEALSGQGDQKNRTAELEGKLDALEKAIEENVCEVKRGGDRCFYKRSEDFLQMPDRRQFKDLRAYALKLLHETVHATGSENRLNRSKGKSFGDANYSQEELVAEMGAWFTAYELELIDEPDKEDELLANSGAYLQSFAENVKKDPKVIYYATQAAQKSAKFIREAVGESLGLEPIKTRSRGEQTPSVEKFGESEAGETSTETAKPETPKSEEIKEEPKVESEQPKGENDTPKPEVEISRWNQIRINETVAEDWLKNASDEEFDALCDQFGVEEMNVENPAQAEAMARAFIATADDKTKAKMEKKVAEKVEGLPLVVENPNKRKATQRRVLV